MLTTFYRVHIKADIKNDSIISDSLWYPALSNIYGNPGSNYDGYVSTVEISDTLDSLTIHCYTVVGPEENDRFDQLKQGCTDWSLYRKSSVTNAVLCYASQLGYKVKGYTVEQF
jgi:hypothetical protein